MAADVPVDVRDAARWLADQPLTLPDDVADRLDVVLAYVVGLRAAPCPAGPSCWMGDDHGGPDFTEYEGSRHV